MTLQELYDVVLERKASADEGSYTASLFSDGLDRIIQKVGEESVEVVIAAKNNDDADFIGEVADLQYHLMVLLAAKGITPADIQDKLTERHNDKTTKGQNQ